MPGGSSFPHPDAFDASGSGETATRSEEDPLLAGPERSATILVTGGSGFLARHLVPRLLGRGHRVRAACRRGAGPAGRTPRGLEWVSADLTDGADVEGLAEECEVVVHLAGGPLDDPVAARRVEIEGTRNLVREADRAGARRVVLVSALGAEEAAGPLFDVKRAAEAVVRSARAEHVILRPSVVVGPDDHVVSVLARALRRGPVLMPGGRVRETGVLQPAAVEDVAEALCQAVERPDLADTTHRLAGPDALAPSGVVRAVAARLSLVRRVIPLPRWTGRRLEGLADRTGLTAPAAMRALDVRALPGEVEDAARALRRVFHLEPLPFAVALDDYL
ncbi:MAG TPA: NAD-dependent epimerase/dehydratase family protein [Gemmatimonadota bacterium]|nr:NAD-dependent epimerase/dehydratase family protein [Gemmatimonadota bacterium]